MDSVPGLRRCPGGGNGNPLQYSNLGNPMDRGAQWAAVHGVAKSRTQLSTHLGITHMNPALIFFFQYWYKSCFLWEKSWFLLESPGIFWALLSPPFAFIPKIYTLTPVIQGLKAITKVWSSPAHGEDHVCSPILYSFAINKLFFSPLPCAKQLWWMLQHTKTAKVAYNESMLQ